MPFPLLAAFLVSAVGPLVKKALIAIGLGIVTYAGLQAAFDAAQAQIIANYGAMAGASLQLADLAGVGQTIGILLGALTARVGMVAASHIGRVL
ncbi:MAG: DUF2523 domain-containing protein [Nitrosomonadales bacterium]|nr:DUF2523 domain-containing protein [Nitrosomonadales bacterium]